jgi:hypothetical protein
MRRAVAGYSIIGSLATQAIQLECDRRRLIYLEHQAFLISDPLSPIGDEPHLVNALDDARGTEAAKTVLKALNSLDGVGADRVGK